MSEVPMFWVLLFGMLGVLISVAIVHRNDRLLHHSWFLFENEFWRPKNVTPLYLLFLLICGTCGGMFIVLGIVSRMGLFGG